MWRAAARRFAILFVGLSAAIVVVSFLFGELVGSAPNRAISLGFYMVGALLTVAGFVFGNRGPVRPVDDDRGWQFGRGLRRASREEQEDAINSGALLAVVGFVLLAVGVVVDSRYRLV